MQRTCQRCGQEAATGRFCRQCGAPLFAENEATSATTRNYQSHQPAQTAPPETPYTSPGYPAPDTSRLYRTPSMPPYAVPPPRKSNAAVWVVLAVFFFLVIGGLASAIMFMRVNANRQQARRGIQVEMPPMPAMPAIPAPPAPPPPPPPFSGKVVRSAADLIYPNTTKSKKVGAAGTEVFEMWTKDDFEDVKKFYQDRLGRPIKSEENQASFVSVGKSKITVTIKPDDDDEDQLVISVIYVALPIPNFR